MKSRQLMLCLKDFLSGLSGPLLPDPSAPAPRHHADAGTDAALRVFLHGLPDRPESGSFPFVVIRFLSGDVENESADPHCEDTLLLAVGVWAPRDQEQAGLLLASTLDALRSSLWRTRVLGDQFELADITVTQPEPKERWHEYHLCTLTTRWNYAFPLRSPV